jgi:hypothetical protein
MSTQKRLRELRDNLILNYELTEDETEELLFIAERLAGVKYEFCPKHPKQRLVEIMDIKMCPKIFEHGAKAIR